MRIGRTLPPAAALLPWADLRHGIAGALSAARLTRAVEENFRAYFGVRHTFLVSSGTAALAVALMALRSLVPRREVVIPAYTCFSVPAAVLKAGLQVKLCDINPKTFDFDHALLERALNDNTLCVVAHHLFGIPSDIERLRALCRPRGIFVVEDAAQAMGIEANGHMAGTLGDVGIFSLGRGKNITCGSGGIIVTSSDEISGAIGREWYRLKWPSLVNVLKELARLVLMAIFIRPSLYWIPAALPFLQLGQTIFPRHVPLERLSGMQAGLLRDWRDRLAESNRIRSRSAQYFCRRLVRLKPNTAGVAGPSHPYLRLPIFADTPERRTGIHLLSQQRGLGVSLAYPTPINEIPELSRLFGGQRFPAARRVADHILTLPTHHWLSERDKGAIAECVETTVDHAPPAQPRPRVGSLPATQPR
jgi:perosamine synthetase